MNRSRYNPLSFTNSKDAWEVLRSSPPRRARRMRALPGEGAINVRDGLLLTRILAINHIRSSVWRAAMSRVQEEIRRGAPLALLARGDHSSSTNSPLYLPKGNSRSFDFGRPLRRAAFAQNRSA